LARALLSIGAVTVRLPPSSRLATGSAFSGSAPVEFQLTPGGNARKHAIMSYQGFYAPAICQTFKEAPSKRRVSYTFSRGIIGVSTRRTRPPSQLSCRLVLLCRATGLKAKCADERDRTAADRADGRPCGHGKRSSRRATRVQKADGAQKGLWRLLPSVCLGEAFCQT
jgi:hypothetical protein